ncbi:hypothetical protein ACJX0J_026082, partial [Zea mays]
MTSFLIHFATILASWVFALITFDNQHHLDNLPTNLDLRDLATPTVTKKIISNLIFDKNKEKSTMSTQKCTHFFAWRMRPKNEFGTLTTDLAHTI